MVIRYRTHVMLQALDSVGGSQSFPARITITDKFFLKDVVGPVEYEVMHDPIPEIGRENLAFDRIVYYETDTSADLVRSVLNFRSKFEQVMLEIHFEFELVDRIPLIPSCVEISLEYVSYQILVPVVCHSILSKVLPDTPHREPAAPIVANVGSGSATADVQAAPVGSTTGRRAPVVTVVAGVVLVAVTVVAVPGTRYPGRKSNR